MMIDDTINSIYMPILPKLRLKVIVQAFSLAALLASVDINIFF